MSGTDSFPCRFPASPGPVFLGAITPLMWVSALRIGQQPRRGCKAGCRVAHRMFCDISRAAWKILFSGEAHHVTLRYFKTKTPLAASFRLGRAINEI